MSNEFVMVPREQLRKIREWIESARDGVLYPIARDFEGVVGRNAEGLGQETPALLDGIDELLAKAAVHLGNPVLYYKPIVGAEAKPTGECYSVFFTPMPGHQPLFASAEPSAPVETAVFNDPLYNAESDARNASALLEEVLEWFDDGCGRSPEEFKLLRKIGDWLGRSVSRIDGGGDECAHSYANKDGCPECGEAFTGEDPSAPECKYCGDTGQIMVGRSGDASDGNAPIMEPCEDCDGPSAPVEIDHDALVAAVCVLRSQGLGNLSAAVEEARAALERKP